MTDSQETPRSSAAQSAGQLDRALALVEFLRANCPWDARQTPESLRRYLLEEAHEVVDAISHADDAALRDELGDLLLNVAFQVVLAEERGAFDREAVAAALEQKMQRRHPHLYGLGEAEPWDTLKARERGDLDHGPILRELPGGEPLHRAHEIQARVARVGFDWPEARGAWQKVREEIDELGREIDGDPDRLEDEIGDVLFSMVNFTRMVGLHAPTAMARANAKFVRRFRRIEELARAQGLNWDSASLEDLDALWDEAKREGL